jgi:hypothetical protein
MKRTLATCTVVAMLVGCGHAPSDGPGSTSGPSPGPACAVSATVPEFDAAGVFVREPLLVQWNTAIDPASVTGQVEVKDLGADPVPITVTPNGPDSFLVTPERSLHFWGEYALIVGDGVTTTAGDACRGEEVAFSTLSPLSEPPPLRVAGVAGIAKVGSHVLTASPTYRGLQIYDVSDPTAVSLVGDVLTEAGPAGLVVRGDRAYAPTGERGVLIFDIGTPEAPVEIGRVGTPGAAMHVAPFEQAGRLLLAIADFGEGVRLVDVTDAAGPEELGWLDPTGNHTAHVRGVDVQGGLLAVAEGRGDGSGALTLYDVGDVANPLLLSHTPDDYDLFDVRIVGDVVYASRGPLGVRSWSIAAPAAPMVIGTLPVAEEENVQRLWIADGELFAANLSVGVERISLDGGGGMTPAAVHDVPGQAAAVTADATHIFAGTEGGLVVYARADASGSSPTWSDPDGHGLAQAVAVLGDRAHVAAGGRGMQTFAVGDGVAPQLIDRDDSPGLVLDIAASSVLSTEGLTILGDARGGITLFDTSNPDNPANMSFIDSIDAVSGMRLVGNVLYACQTNAGLIIADLSDPIAPSVLSAAAIPPDKVACLDVVTIGTTALIGGNLGLGMADVTDPSSPAWLGWATMPETGALTHLQLVGDWLLASFRTRDYEGTYNVSRKLMVFDVSDPLAPALAWESDNLSGSGDIAVAGDIAFMAGADQGVFVFDISDPGAPVLEGSIATTGNAIGLALGPGTLYVAQGHGGLATVILGTLPPH